MSARHGARWLAAWTIVVAVGLGWNLGGPALGDQDEGRNAEVAREMAAGNDYVLPHLNGLPYIDKPVLSFALSAAVMEILGPTELAARAVPYLCTLLTAVLVGVCARRWYGSDHGWVAAIATLAAPLPLAFARIAILDAVLALAVTGALLAFHTAVEARARGGSFLRWTLIAWAAIGLGALTKGPVGLAVPLMVAAPYAIWRRASVAVWHPIGPAVFVAVIGPWVAFMEHRLPGYLEYVAVTETWQRISSDELRRTQPWWFFIVVGAAGFFPWWLPASGRQLATRRDPRRVFAWLWLVVPLIFFSISRSKLPQYILPLAPAVALLAASRWDSRRGLRGPGSLLALAGWALLAVALTAVGFGAIDRTRVAPEILAVVHRPALAMGVVCLAAVAWGVLAVRSRRGAQLVAALSLPVAALPVVLQPVITAAAERRSERALAEVIRTELPAETEVVGFRAWRPSLAFYLSRPIPVLTIDGDELRSNYILRTHQRWILPDGMLRPLPDGTISAPACDQPHVFLTHARRPDDHRLMEEAGMERIWAGPKLHAYYCDGHG